MKKEEKLKRILARGEHSNHSHVLFGNIEFLENCMKLESPDFEKGKEEYHTYHNLLDALKKEYSDYKTNADFKAKKIVLQTDYNNKIEGLDVVSIRHIYESNFMDTGSSVWTQEHVHIPFKSGDIAYRPQVGLHPYSQEIERVRD